MNMKPVDINDFSQCKIDFPLEFSPEEIATLATPINTLLKCNYIIGTSLDVTEAFQTLFDIAFEITDVDCCAYISAPPNSDDFEIVVSRHLSLEPGGKESLFLPAALAKSFNKGIHLESGKNSQTFQACQELHVSSLVAYPLRKNLDFIGALAFGKKKSNPFTPVEMKLLWVLSGHAENLVLQGDAMKTLSFYSFLDPLTHLYNRRYFDDLLEKEITRSQRNGKPVSLLMLDLDGFKAYNDTFLHSSGDIALQEVAAILQVCSREVDTVARLGGDEFAIILVDSHAVGARDLGNRIIDKLKEHRFPGLKDSRTERLSMSVGVATFPADAYDKQDLVRKADHALHMAKNHGGRQVYLFNYISDLVSSQTSTPEVSIQKIYEAARSVVDMDKSLEILLVTAMQGMSARRGSIVASDPEGRFTLRAAIELRNGEERFPTGTIIRPGAVTTWVMEHKEPLLVTGQEEIPVPVPLTRNGYQSDSFLSLPLVYEGRVLGVLHLTDRTGNQPFTRDDLKAFEPVSREITSILAQGILFRENVKIFSTSFLQSLANALELRFPFLGGHCRRVQDISLRIGRRLGLGDRELSGLGTAAALHDIGIVGIPGEILQKTRKLGERELEIVRKHPFLGAKLLEGIPGMEETARVILEHQEFFNGSGYPNGIRGGEISLGARIVSLAEYYDSITSARPHRGGLSRKEALQLVKNNRNTLFDERISRAFLEEMETATLVGNNL